MTAIQRRASAAAGLLALLGTACASPPAEDALAASAQAGSPQSVAAGAMPPARFADPDRRAKLMAALPEIDRLFRDFATRSRVPGIAYGVLIDGELVHAGTHGLRDLSSQAAVEGTTVFRIASMTKSFTAAAILRLRDEGKLSLDDPVERHVPELASLAYPTSDSPRLTIRHLLSHSEGFPEDNPWGDRQLDATEEEMSAMLRGGIPFSNAPGVAYEYSNYGFAILGRIIANVSGQPYPQYMRTNVLEPLGMTSSTLEPATVPADRLAHGYRLEDGEWKDEPPLPDGAFGPMGGMLTTIEDLGRWVGFMMEAWPPRDGPEQGPVRRSSLREMQQVARAQPARVTRTGTGAVDLTAGGYGYGLRISQTCDLGHVVAHSGGLPGYGSQMRWLPEHGVGIIALGNLTYTGWQGVITDALAAMQRTGALQPRVPQPSPALLEARASVARLIIQWDDGLADELAAMNLYLDESKERRQRHVQGLTARTGPCRDDGVFVVENALRGRWRMSCERGALDVAITLAPTIPPRVQYLAVELADPAQPMETAPTCPSA